MARVSQGVAAYCSADDLGKYVFDSFIGGRHTKAVSECEIIRLRHGDEPKSAWKTELRSIR